MQMDIVTIKSKMQLQILQITSAKKHLSLMLNI